MNSELPRVRLYLECMFKLEICHKCLLPIAVGEAKHSDVDAKIEFTKEVMAEMSERSQSRMGPLEGWMFIHYHKTCWGGCCAVARQW